MCELCTALNSECVITTDATVAIIRAKSSAAAIMVVPKQHGPLHELPKEVQQHLFTTASTLSSLIFDTMNVHGTNIIADDSEHASYTILGRTEQDTLDLRWKPTRASPDELVETAKRVSSETWYIGKEEKEQKTSTVSADAVPSHTHEPKEGESAKDVAADIQKTVHEGPTDKHNYLIRQLTRRR